METEIKIFISYLHNTKRMSGNTVVSYERDLRKMMLYFQEVHQMTRVQDITETSLNSYMLYLEKESFRSVYGIEKRGFHACVFPVSVSGASHRE